MAVVVGQPKESTIVQVVRIRLSQDKTGFVSAFSRESAQTISVLWIAENSGQQKNEAHLNPRREKSGLGQGP